MQIGNSLAAIRSSSEAPLILPNQHFLATVDFRLYRQYANTYESENRGVKYVVILAKKWQNLCLHR